MELLAFTVTLLTLSSWGFRLAMEWRFKTTRWPLYLIATQALFTFASLCLAPIFRELPGIDGLWLTLFVIMQLVLKAYVVITAGIGYATRITAYPPSAPLPANSAPYRMEKRSLLYLVLVLTLMFAPGQ